MHLSSTRSRGGSHFPSFEILGSLESNRFKTFSASRIEPYPDWTLCSSISLSASIFWTSCFFALTCIVVCCILLSVCAACATWTGLPWLSVIKAAVWALPPTVCVTAAFAFVTWKKPWLWITTANPKISNMNPKAVQALSLESESCPAMAPFRKDKRRATKDRTSVGQSAVSYHIIIVTITPLSPKWLLTFKAAQINHCL